MRLTPEELSDLNNELNGYLYDSMPDFGEDTNTTIQVAVNLGERCVLASLIVDVYKKDLDFKIVSVDPLEMDEWLDYYNDTYHNR